jgi:hypothetical protein
MSALPDVKKPYTTQKRRRFNPDLVSTLREHMKKKIGLEPVNYEATYT